MILAVSRFRVANGLEGEVARAFAERPQLVDRWPGFLGMETFTDTADHAVFYLVTRWASTEAFHAWHHSSDHRESHKWIPKGLRLDPAFTKVVQLERLPEPDSLTFNVLTRDANDVVAAYFRETRFVHVVRVDARGEIVFINDVLRLRLGLDAAAAPGRQVFEHLTAHDAAALREHLSHPTFSTRQTVVSFCDAEGMPFSLSAFLTVYDDGFLLIGEPVYEDEQRLHRQLIGVTEELAGLARRRHRSAAAAQEEQRRAEAENRAKDQALAVIAHELRQPLNAAVAASYTLRTNPANAEKVQAMLERQITQMSALVEDLLNASRIMHGRIELDRARVDVREVLADAAETAGESARRRSQQLNLKMPDAPVLVDADLVRLRQVCANLLNNAVKYTPEEGVIAAGVERDSDSVIVRVRDTGDGIPEHDLERIFELFARATSGGNGLGIGLAVTRRLVEAHGGTITASSDGPGKGSEFVVTLPLASDEL